MRMLLLVLAAALLLCAGAFAQEIKTEKNVVYGQGGGHDLIMHVTEVDDGVDFKPAMVCIHGGGWAGGEPDAMLGMAEGMAKIGFKCFSIQYRLTGEAKWPAQIIDCKTAVRHIRANAKKYNINPNRIGAMGHSAGGHLCCMLGVLKPGEYEGVEHPAVSSQIQGVVNYCGPEDFGYYLTLTHLPPPISIRDDALGWLFDGTPEGRDYWIPEASPITHVSRASAPHLLIHGTTDDLVWYRQAEPYRDRLRACGVRCDWVLVEGGWHIIDNYDIWPDITKFCKEVFFK
ncbi:MAG: alpha/beta hydrolase [Abditibacteriota bacterium]|nr:alpha/beta hydrolase [Abditibacteriota bacterium]